METITRNPTKGIYAATPDYAHALEMRHPSRFLYVTSYLRDPAYVEANQTARVAALKGRAVPATAIVVQTLVPEWLVELEIVAAG